MDGWINSQMDGWGIMRPPCPEHLTGQLRRQDSPDAIRKCRKQPLLEFQIESMVLEHSALGRPVRMRLTDLQLQGVQVLAAGF